MKTEEKMKWAHVFIMVAAFGILSAGWWVGKVSNDAYVPTCLAAIGGSLWMANKTSKTDTPTPKIDTNVVSKPTTIAPNDTSK